MDQQPIRYAVFRDRRQWDSVMLGGLTAEEDGVLSLAGIPGPADEKAISIPSPIDSDPGPFDSNPSGLATGPCNDVVLSDTANHQVIWCDGVCPDRTLRLGSGAGNASSQFEMSCGLLIHADSLYVADSGNGRVQIFRLPTLELRSVWTGMFQKPTGLAVDSQGNIYVLDQGLKRVFRFTSIGAPDANYMSWTFDQPLFIAIDGQDQLYVTESQTHRILQFKQDGTALGALPEVTALKRPSALAARGNWVYGADAESGKIWLFDVVSNSYLGTLPGYRGPVSAMAIGPDDSLWLKPGLDQTYYRLEPKKVFLSQGLLTTQDKDPLDAGEGIDWARVHVDVEMPPGTLVQLRLIARANSAPAPNENDWEKAEVLPLDTLVPPLLGTQDAEVGVKRFLWVRVVVTTEQATVTPRLLQVEAETMSPSYLDHLPAVYRRADAPTRFLERWLKLVQGEIDDWESRLEGMPRQFDALMTPEDQLSWLAKWLAFPLPKGHAAHTLRAVFAKVPDLYAHRGTPGGVCDLTELYTGARPHLFEAFHARRVWQLGKTSALGLDTALPPALPDGMVVPGWSVADPELMGLRGDYYAGINFAQLKATRRDSEVDFHWDAASPMPDVLDTDNFSVRWTGQVQPRHTDLYTFHTVSDDGVRLWIDGRLIIDNWTDHSPSENHGQIALSADRWYTLTLEYYEKAGGATVTLSWSSRNQPKEIIPQERLYAIRDEQATLGGPVASADTCPVLVGQTVVGESQPLGASEYGASLYSEAAHLFTVSVPAASLSSSSEREMLRAVIEREKPAHTDYHLCFVKARMRVGFQARIGIDSISAGMTGTASDSEIP
ncbi:MAG: PA14 domain-containing protein, partial [Nitrospirota bacterium]